MPSVVEVKAQKDFWDRLCKTKPIRAISELIWNSFDADSKTVSVSIDTNAIHGIDRIRISDDGDGIPYDENKHLFSSLGGSWKNQTNRTLKEKRILHGRTGQGRFRAFALGERVTWSTRYEFNSGVSGYEIFGSSLESGIFRVGDPQSFDDSGTGTEVLVENVSEQASELLGQFASDSLSRIFAPYLIQYRGVKLVFNGQKIDTANLVERSSKHNLGPYKLSDGSRISAELEIIEWRTINGRALYLCDENGFALAERAPEIRAPGFNFGAYLKSKHFSDLDEGHLIDIDLSEGITVLVANAKDKLSEYFKARELEKTASLIRRWKNEDVYPYKEEPKSPVAKNTQRIFNMCALTLHEHVNGFEDQDKKSKALSFRLLKEAIEGSPGEVARIFNEVLLLPKRKQEQLSELLDKTELSSIIDAVSDINNRINIGQGLRALVCGADIRNSVKERQHIHQIVERNPWLFGEQFALGQSESSLTNALREHLRRMSRSDRVLEPVLKASGQAGRVDIMLAKRIKRSGRDDDEHLVVELKRANKILSLKDFNQLLEYATAVTRDKRFNKTDVRWSFWLVGVEFSAELEEATNSADREPGCVHIFKDGRGEIWVKTWAQIVHDALSRLEFVREKLNIAVTEEDAIEYLNRIYPDFVPAFEDA